MRRGSLALSALFLVGLGLTGCGVVRHEQREPWRTQAEEVCLAQKLVQPTAYMAMAAPIEGPGTCGMTRPFKVAALSGGSVGLAQKLTLACPVIPHIDGWLNEVVQPAATMYFGQRVVEIRSGSYSCRGRNNQRGARLSEHSFGNAVDVMAFRLADGRDIPVAKGWRGAEVDQEFLREIFVGACQYFTTVLGPGSDMFHYDHFHLDLARHDPRGQRHICKPIIKFTPRLGNPLVAQAPVRLPLPDRVRPAPAQAHAQDPVEEEAEEDPYEATPTSARESGARVAQREPPPPLPPAIERPMPSMSPIARRPATPDAFATRAPMSRATASVERGPAPAATPSHDGRSASSSPAVSSPIGARAHAGVSRGPASADVEEVRALPKSAPLYPPRRPSEPMPLHSQATSASTIY